MQIENCKEGQVSASAPVAEEKRGRRVSGIRRPRVLLVNAFDKIPGESFRDQRYTFLYSLLKDVAEVRWISSDFHHWSHARRDRYSLPLEDRNRIELVKTIAYTRNVSVRRAASYLFLSLRTIRELIKLPWKPDVVLCMGPVEQMFIISLYGRIVGTRIVIDVLDLWPDVYVTAVGRRLRPALKVLLAPYYFLSYLTFAWASEVTAVSRTYACWAQRRGRRHDRHRFSFYYLGCLNDSFRSEPLKKTGQDITCLFAGQFGHSYDVELVISAAELMLSRGGHNINFVLCGGGEKWDIVASRSRKLANVALHRWQSPEELNRIASGCQIGLCPYKPTATQSVPTKVFDYLSMGLYVVSSLQGEASELLARVECGATYAAGSLEALVETLKWAVSAVDLSPDGRMRIRRAFEKEFDARKIYQRMVSEVVLDGA